jgi:glyoxylase-like metal-dependent hydrolase (beta-lactamase superfamily II)
MSETHVDVLTSGIWQTTSTIIRNGRSCLVVDPGYFPRELADLARLIPQGVFVEALFFTHGHWDHVVGHGMFPCVPVYASSVLARYISEGGELVAKAMAKAQEFDSRWYVERPWGYVWPADLRGLDDGDRFSIGDLDVEAFLIPGHTPNGMAIRAESWLLVGDYLSPCEIPFVDNLADYRRTLQRLLSLITTDIETVIPGHGPQLSVEEARRIAREDLCYLDSIARCAESIDSAAAFHLPLPRAENVVGMHEHHAENCRKAGLSVTLAGSKSSE